MLSILRFRTNPDCALDTTCLRLIPDVLFSLVLNLVDDYLRLDEIDIQVMLKDYGLLTYERLTNELMIPDLHCKLLLLKFIVSTTEFNAIFE
jgi:hypothetical protein